MTVDQILIVLIGTLADGFVNGLTGFGTGITAMGIWLYPPLHLRRPTPLDNLVTFTIFATRVSGQSDIRWVSSLISASALQLGQNGHSSTATRSTNAREPAALALG